MSTFYILQPEFFHFFKVQPQLLLKLNVKDEQRKKLFCCVQFQDLVESACSYFEKPISYEENCMYYTHPITKSIFTLYFKEDHFILDGAYNPFLALLKRVYPNGIHVEEFS